MIYNPSNHSNIHLHHNNTIHPDWDFPHGFPITERRSEMRHPAHPLRQNCRACWEFDRPLLRSEPIFWIWLWPMTDPAGAGRKNANITGVFVDGIHGTPFFWQHQPDPFLDLVMTFTVGHGKSLVVMELSSWVNQRFSMANCWS